MAIGLTFDTAHHCFNERSAAIIRQEGHLLCTTSEGLGFWFLPGGRLKRGETSAMALRRELHEELHVDVRIGAPRIVAESFFLLDGQHYHELAFYFEVTCPASIPFVLGEDCHHLREGDQDYRYRWIDLSLPSLAKIDLRPHALHDHFIDPPPEPQHIIING